jgi:Uri superfamily endonuclease
MVWTSVFLLLAGTVFALKNGYNISRGSSMLFHVRFHRVGRESEHAQRSGWHRLDY